MTEFNLNMDTIKGIFEKDLNMSMEVALSDYERKCRALESAKKWLDNVDFTRVYVSEDGSPEVLCSHIIHNGHECVITEIDLRYSMQITFYPLDASVDIGNGQGLSVTLNFQAEDYEQ